MESGNYYSSSQQKTNGSLGQALPLQMNEGLNPIVCSEIDIQNYGSLCYDSCTHLDTELQFCCSISQTSSPFYKYCGQAHDLQDFGYSNLKDEHSCQHTQTSTPSIDMSSRSGNINGDEESSDDESTQVLVDGNSDASPQHRQIFYRSVYKQYAIKELRKEFNRNRFFFNHFEFVDFTIFECGLRRHYLLWRMLSLLVILLMSLHIFLPDLEVASKSMSDFIFMHCWLYILLIFHGILEVISLLWIFFKIESNLVGRIHYTPAHFKVIWFLYNTLYPNMMSCNFMYYIILNDMELYVADYSICHAILASYLSIHVSVTATPSRLVHFVQPLSFNLFYILYIVLYQVLGYTNSSGQHFVYKEIDFVNEGSAFLLLGIIVIKYSGDPCCVLVVTLIYAFLRAFLWCCLTCVCHILIVLCSWFRRLIFRFKRGKIDRCKYGISTVTYAKFRDEPRQYGSLPEKIEYENIMRKPLGPFGEIKLLGNTNFLILEDL